MTSFSCAAKSVSTGVNDKKTASLKKPDTFAVLMRLRINPPIVKEWSLGRVSNNFSKSTTTDKHCVLGFSLRWTIYSKCLYSTIDFTTFDFLTAINSFWTCFQLGFCWSISWDVYSSFFIRFLVSKSNEIKKPISIYVCRAGEAEARSLWKTTMLAITYLLMKSSIGKRSSRWDFGSLICLISQDLNSYLSLQKFH